MHKTVVYYFTSTCSSKTLNAASSAAAALAAQAAAQKQTGPVNGDECYFWRTTGCLYGNKCHWKHLPDHKGVDRKPWQKVK